MAFINLELAKCSTLKIELVGASAPAHKSLQSMPNGQKINGVLEHVRLSRAWAFLCGLAAYLPKVFPWLFGIHSHKYAVPLLQNLQERTG